MVCFFRFLERTKNQIDMKKAFKLFPYLLFMLGIIITSCEYCDDDDSDNNSISQQNLQNQEFKK